MESGGEVSNRGDLWGSCLIECAGDGLDSAVGCCFDEVIVLVGIHDGNWWGIFNALVVTSECVSTTQVA